MSNIKFTMKDLDGTVMPYTSFVISTSTSANAASFTTNLNGEATVTLAAVSTPYYISKQDGTTESVIAYKFFVPNTTYTLDAELLFVDMGKISKDKNDKSIAALIEAKVVAVNAANRALQVVSLLGDVSTIRDNLDKLVQVASNLTSINAVNANATNITTVASNTANINKVATIDTNVTTVANSQASVNTVATNIANVNTVAPHTANIGTVATNIANVSNVATNISNINAAVANSTNINSVVVNAANINKVSAIDTKVDSVANNEANINTVSSSISAVNTVASNNTNINTVAGNITKVSNISGEIAKVVNVANNLSSINTANNNASKVTTVANNISNVIAVGNSIDDVSIVADGMNNLPPIIPYLANIHTIASNIAPVVAVGNNINNINEVRAMEADLEAIADNIAYLSNASAAVTQGVDAQKELFINGTDYTKNTSSFLALTYLPAKTNSVKVFFDGSYQNKDTWTRVGKTLSFVSPISANKVEVHYEIPSAFVGLSPEDTLTLQNSENAAKASEIDAQQSASAAAVSASAALNIANQAIDGRKELFVDGVHYTKNTSTQVVLDTQPAKSNTVKVFFDGSYQHSDTYVRVGKTIAFNSVIAANKVEVQYEIPSLFVALDATDNEVLENAQLFAQYQANEALVNANNSQTFANNSAQSYADTLDITTQAVDAIKQLFVAGTNYTKNTSIQLTMDFLPVKTNAVKVFFDGVYQNKDTFTRVGKVITFNEAINVDNVEIHYEVPSQFVGLDDDDNALLVAAQNAAQASANAAAASFDSFDDRYLGAKSVAPTVDNDGNTLLVGAKYFNSTENKMYVRNSSNVWQWDTADSSTVNYLPAGTGAVATDVQSRLRERVSVFDFMTAAQISAVKNNDYSSISDVSAAVQAALDSGGGNPVFVEFSDGKYRVKDLVVKYPNVSITANGNNCWFLNIQPFTGFADGGSTPHRPTVWIAANNCSISGICFSYPAWIEAGLVSLKTPRTATDPWYGSHISVGFTRMWESINSGVYNTLFGVTLSIIENTRIDGVNILGSAVHGIAVFNAIDTKITNTKVNQFKATGVFANYVRLLDVSRCEFKTSGDDGVFVGVEKTALNGVWTPLTDSDMRSITLHENVVYRSGAKGLSVQGFDIVSITDNTIDSCYSVPLSAWREGRPEGSGCSNVLISGNIVKDAFGAFGLQEDGYYNQESIVAAVGGTYHGIDLGGSKQITVTDNVIHLTTKTLTQSEHLALRSIGSTKNFQDAVISNNYFKRFVRATIGRESAATPVTSNVAVVNNIFDAKEETELARLVQIGVNANLITVSNNVFLSASAGAAGWAALYCLAGSRVIAQGNVYGLSSTLVKVRSDGSYLLSDPATDALSTSDITALSIAKRVLWLAAAPTDGTFGRGDIVYTSTPSANGFVGWVCVTGGNPGTWKTFGAISA